MTDRENTMSANPDKKREELIGKVLVTNDLLGYQDGNGGEPDDRLQKDRHHHPLLLRCR